MKHFAIGMIFAAATSVPARSESVMSASQLFQMCDAPKPSSASLSCEFYIRGFISGLIVDQVMAKGKSAVCVPMDVTGVQARLIAEKYRRSNPEQLHLDASAFLGIAFLNAFPCRMSK